MAKKKDKEEMVVCPVGRFFMDVNDVFDRTSPFLEHFNRSRIELLKGVRALVDEKISSLEKKDASKSRKRATKIKVE